MKCEYFDGKLETIDLFSRGETDLLIDGVDLFNTETLALLQQLESKNGGSKENKGSVLFDKLGIILGRYYSSKSKSFYDTNEQDDRDVCVYSKTGLDKLLTMLRHPYKKVSFLTQSK